jgi:hypothetical protein
MSFPQSSLNPEHIQGLMSSFDGKDHFQTGHSRRSGPTLRMRKMPEWMKNEKNIHALLLRVFPKLKTDARQRTSAAHWAGLIRLYFKSGWKARDVAGELNISEKQVYDTAQRITRAGAGLRTTGKRRTGRRGRPKSIRF